MARRVPKAGGNPRNLFHVCPLLLHEKLCNGDGRPVHRFVFACTGKAEALVRRPALGRAQTGETWGGGRTCVATRTDGSRATFSRSYGGFLLPFCNSFDSESSHTRDELQWAPAQRSVRPRWSGCLTCADKRQTRHEMQSRFPVCLSRFAACVIATDLTRNRSAGRRLHCDNSSRLVPPTIRCC